LERLTAQNHARIRIGCAGHAQQAVKIIKASHQGGNHNHSPGRPVGERCVDDRPALIHSIVLISSFFDGLIIVYFDRIFKLSAIFPVILHKKAEGE